MTDQTDIEALGWTYEAGEAARDTGRRGAGHNSGVFRNLPARYSAFKRLDTGGGHPLFWIHASTTAALLDCVQRFQSQRG